jgi:hypothetical protein
MVLVLAVVPILTIPSWAQSEAASQNSDQQPSSGQMTPQVSIQDDASGATDEQQSSSSDTASSSAPSTQPYTLNRPIVAVNLPLKVLGGETRSFFLPGAQISAGTDTNQREGFSSTNTYGTVRGLGSMSLQKLWSRYDFGADYIGGLAYLGYRALDHSILQTGQVDQHVAWKTGQFEARDLFSYLPDGNFGASAYGGIPALAGLNGSFIGGLIGEGIFSSGQLATLGEQPRINNAVLGDVTQYLSPRSSIGAVTSYSLTHFTGNQFDLINSWQVVSQASYDYQLNRRDQIAILYAHQTFRYPSKIGNDIDTNYVQLLFGHRVSSHIQFIGGAGPEFLHILPAQQCAPTTLSNGQPGSVCTSSDPINRTTLSARASLKYNFRETDLSLSYLRYTTNGSGLFAGATSNVLRFAASRPLGRLWGGQAEIGYNTNHRLYSIQGTNSATNFDYLLAGAGVHRQVTREVSAFVSLLFTNTSFNQPFCLGSSCGKNSEREVFLLGLDWHPHPIRLE